MNLNLKNDKNVLKLVNYRICEEIATKDKSLEDNFSQSTIDLPLLKFNKLEEIDFINHCFTTREGGVSKNHLSSLNLSFTRGDEREKVLENYRRLAIALECNLDDFVLSSQTHTTNVLRVTKEDAGNGITKELPYDDIDGLVTNEPGLVLSTFYADCVPLYFVDTKNKAIGLSHSGWRGTVKRMGQVTLEKMAKEFGTDPKDVICAIGPSICQQCYEVSLDVANEFIDEFKGHEDEIIIYKENDKCLLNLWRANEIVLEDAGVLKENIAITNVCTCCNSKYLYSHRASNGKRGNLGAFMYIK
ncbi:peptidoglycan editing factor PgeF [Lachnobacterium bovis]|uniref:Purine nucleoside phosphorylase n=1 Tax=Lachnobacterium bovis TaxID=140626 RepID=A0A1H9TRA8_9FIRM|nr:peptidoglycan editing factor PgeF [Lachnobacterium bovis]SER99840.1 conserved hypothetical protein [Lachnobacterium bovis]